MAKILYGIHSSGSEGIESHGQMEWSPTALDISFRPGKESEQLCILLWF